MSPSEIQSAVEFVVILMAILTGLLVMVTYTPKEVDTDDDL